MVRQVVVPPYTVLAAYGIFTVTIPPNMNGVVAQTALIGYSFNESPK